MDSDALQAVGRAIEMMRENFGEELTVDDLAQVAMFSKFHFSRVFRQAIGISPGRFLSAVRLQEAKRLLRRTSLTIADISNQVGYTSVGTFSTRFKGSVGIAPSQYRQSGGDMSLLYGAGDRTISPPRPTIVHGEVLCASPERVGRVFVGLFPNWILEGPPIQYTLLSRPGPYMLQDVPQGTWYLLVHRLSGGEFSQGQTPTVGTCGPINIRRDIVTRKVNVEIRPASEFDPPVLLAALDIPALELNARAG
ncbi:AraC family transcriptional regulator [Streptosporangium sp. NPDC051022]|uniref:AraC family transcriptional regulator n=1 Tax=Streptosporangium sp. NPDC051022 TaxID=3155752 RepID=UPI00342BA092